MPETPGQTRGICAIVPWGQHGLHPHVIGMGILVGPREVITCAHVAGRPGDAVQVCFPFAPSPTPITGAVDPARYHTRHAQTAPADVAVILLDTDAPIDPARFAPYTSGAACSAYGFRSNKPESSEPTQGVPESHPTGEWATFTIAGPLPGERIELVGLSQLGARVEPGFSGSAVYDAQHDAIVGMIVTADREAARRTAQALTTPSLSHVLGRNPAEIHYLHRLLRHLAHKPRYSEIQGVADFRPSAHHDPCLQPWAEDQNLAALHYESEHHREEFSDAVQAFHKVRRAALLGAPGAGKSTTLRRRAADLALLACHDKTAPIPILLTLGNWRDDKPLAQFIATQISELGPAVDTLGRAGRLALLLDGLNEMPTARRGEKASEIKDWIASLPPHTEVVVTCRLGDYTGPLHLGLDTLTLLELKPQRVREILRMWMTAGGGTETEADDLFWQLAGDKDLAGVLSTWLQAGATEERFWTVQAPKDEEAAYNKTTAAQDELWQRHVPNPRSLLKLAANPFLLTMLFHVARSNNGHPPRNRADLFQRFVNALLQREGLMLGTPGQPNWRRSPQGVQLVSGLTNLAWQMQTERAAGNGDAGAGVLTVLAHDEVLRTLGDPELLKKALDGTLLEGDDEIRFRHQLLQEYFTALALQQRLPSVPATSLWPPVQWWERSGWEETAVLLAGLYPEDCSTVLRWLEKAQPEVAAQCVTESGAKVPDTVLQDWKRQWLPLLTDITKEPRPEARAAIGRALARLQLDDRKGVGLKDGVPDIEWVCIPGGTFSYQGKPRDIETFCISRYLVTNAQYAAFLSDPGGYHQDRWWQEFTDTVRSSPSQPRWAEANHPGETVDWWEAMAFCAWLSHRTGYEVRLPTEWEWERAAGGVQGYAYPWGKKYKQGHANINEPRDKAGPHYLQRTSPVGIYPHGASKEGVLDLAGNVREWCCNEYSNPERIQKSGREPRVLRGGSWGVNRERARSARRSGWPPGARHDFIGFRVVCSSPIPLTTESLITDH